MKDEEDCHKFVIDKDATEIVKKTFYYVIKEYSKKEIADKLNQSNIITPSKYFKTILKYKTGKVSDCWNTRIVDDILKDESYAGHLIQGKRQRLSHKTHNIARIVEDDWMVVKDYHKPIINPKMFYQVQNILYNRNIKIKRDGSYALYSGYIKCADCKNNMYRKTKKKINQSYYYCGTYMRTHNCTKYYITEEELNEIVLEMLNKYIGLLCELKDKVEDTINTSSIEYDMDI